MTFSSDNELLFELGKKHGDNNELCNIRFSVFGKRSMNGFLCSSLDHNSSSYMHCKGQPCCEICHLNLICHSSGGRSVLQHVGVFFCGLVFKSCHVKSNEQT